MPLLFSDKAEPFRKLKRGYRAPSAGIGRHAIHGLDLGRRRGADLIPLLEAPARELFPRRYAGLPCRISATNRETLAGFSPQTAKPETFGAKFA
jgi:hypothetical protein